MASNVRLRYVLVLLRHSANYPTPETARDARYPYALTKYLGEQLVLHWAQVYGCRSVRFFNVYGPRARTSGTYGAVFGVFLAQLLAEKPLTVVGDGEQTRDFTFVTDVVDAIFTVASDKVGEVYNVGSGKPVSVNDCFGYSGRPRRSQIYQRPGEPDCTGRISPRSAGSTGRPRWRFAEGVRAMLGKYGLLARRAGLDGVAHRGSDERLVPISREQQ